MRVAVLGGGIQGCCLALELASRGVSVHLVETALALMAGASRHSEGKIHLGFVYANDPSLRSAEQQARGAATFLPLLRRWLGGAIYDVPVSAPFNYAVHERSLVVSDRLEETYRTMEARLAPLSSNGEYFGIERPYRVARVGRVEAAQRYGPAVQAVFATREVAVDPDALADLLVKRVGEVDGIRVRLRTGVMAIEPRTRRVIVQTEAGEMRLGPFDHVVNCTWNGRLAIDATMDLRPPGAWSFRMKDFLRITPAPDHPVLPSTTVVLGGFGDVVDYGTGEYFLSWYPVSRRGWSTGIAPPRWPTRPDAGEARRIARGIIAGLSDVVPGVASLPLDGDGPIDVRGGVIYALGESDVDDPASRLHERHEVGVTSRGWYHTIDTGKYTTAPLFAVQTADRVLGDRP